MAERSASLASPTP